MHAEEDSAGFWPGYVAAVASLVQALLLLSAVTAMAVFQLGGVIGQQMDEEAARMAAGETLGPSSGPGAGASTAKPSPGITANGGARTMARPLGAAQALTHRNQVAPLNIAFTDSNWQLSEADMAQLTTELRKLQKQEGQRWRIWLQTDIVDPAKRKLGYLRIMAVRNVLIRMGVERDLIDTQLFDIDSSKHQTDDLTVHVAPSERKPIQERP